MVRESGYRLSTNAALEQRGRAGGAWRHAVPPLRVALTEPYRWGANLSATGTGVKSAALRWQDLAERDVSAGAPPIDLSVSLGSHYNPLVRRMRALPKPIVCAVNGIAAGAGANLALACDVVVAARSASFVQSFSRLGLVPDAGGSYFLPRLVGMARAMGLALLVEKLDAEQAAQWGLIWKVVDDAELPAVTRALAEKLASGPTKGYGLLKKAIYASAGNLLDAQLDLERDLQREAGLTDDYREGVTAFKEKREPRFKGQ